MPSFAESIQQSSARACAARSRFRRRGERPPRYEQWSWLSAVVRQTPYLSRALPIAVGVSIGIQGWVGLSERLPPLAISQS
jgi:hypothetical protein